MIRTGYFKRTIAPLIMAGFLIGAAPASFQNSAGRAVVESVASILQSAQMVGQGRLSVFGFHIYDARLFATPAGLGSGQLPDKPFALDLRYARAIKGGDIAKRSTKEMESLKMGTADTRARWEGQMRAIFPNVAKGDHLTGVYLPGQGARFLKNGQVIGEVADPQFAQAFFAIWLHPNTRAPALRAALLKQTSRS